MQPLFSVRMRAAVGASHEAGGQHLSGGERLVPEEEVDDTVRQMLARARSRDLPPDFVRITVERVGEAPVHRIPCLPVTTVHPADARSGWQMAARLLNEAGVSEVAVAAAFEGLRAGWQRGASVRGAVVLDAASGMRLDPQLDRGVRVSRLDYAATTRADLENALARQSLGHFRVREALAIASKVVWAGVLAEVCWSDEPEYTTGYVATAARGYVRFTDFKPKGAVGGRVFFASTELEAEGLAAMIERLERGAALIEGPVVIHPPVPGSDFC